MRKLLPVVLTGLLAVSFSQLAAAQSTTVQGSTGADASADVKSKPADTTVGGSACAQTGGAISTDKSTASGSTAATGGSSTGLSAGAGQSTGDDTPKASPAANPNVTRDEHGR